MSLAILTRPIKTSCNFNAVGNPVVYTIQRQDSGFDHVNNVAGNAQIQIDGIDLTAYYQVGNTVYIGRTGYYTTAVITASAFTAGNTLITTTHAYNGDGTGIINNNSKRTDYIIAVEVFNATTNESISPPLFFTPESDGVATIDISSILNGYVSPDFIPVVGPNNIETDTSIEVFIKHTYYYDGGWASGSYAGGLTSDSANPIVGVHAVMQLLLDPLNLTRYAHGGNLLDYMPDDTDSLWLSRFQRTATTLLKVWRGWPFTMSLIWPSTEAVIKTRVIQKTVSGSTISTTTTTLTDTTQNRIHRFTLPTLDATCATIEVTLLDNANVAIASTLFIEVIEPCSHAIHLFWKNSFGGDSFWQFEFNQEYQYAYSGGRKTSRLTLFAHNLSITEWEALNELNSPTDVLPALITDLGMGTNVKKTHFRDDQQVYMLSQDGATKIGVVVIPTALKTMTRHSKHSLEIQIELPEQFTI